jgi:DNA-binding transcriptional regulator YiaG
MNVKEIRNKFGLSQDAFAAKLQVAPFSVRRWERGGKISQLAKYKIEQTFKVKVTE